MPYKPRKAETLHGDGIISDAYNAVKNTAKKAYKRVSDVFSGIRKDYPPSVRATIAKYGDQPIKSMIVRRDPLPTAIELVSNAITRGVWSKAKAKYAYDKLFHLAIEATVGDTLLTIEKNQVINISQKQTARSEKTQEEKVELGGQHPTLSEFLQKGEKRMGDKYYTYDAFRNNCQDYILNLLEANGLDSPELKAFIKQDLTGFVSDLPPWLERIARNLTDLAGVADVAVEGQGKNSPRPTFRKQIVDTGITPALYLRRVRARAKKAGYNPKDVCFSNDDIHKIMVYRPDGKVTKAGRVGYGDFVLWSELEKRKVVEKGYALMKRNTFKVSHEALPGNWASDKYSPNNVALHILW
jgi:hypothetical protein